MRKIFILLMMSIILNGFHPTISQAHDFPVNEQGCHGVLRETVYVPLDNRFNNIYDIHCHNDDVEQEEMFQEIEAEKPDEADEINIAETPPAPPTITKTGAYVGTIAALLATHNTTEEGVAFDNPTSIGLFVGTKISQNFGFEFILKNTKTPTTISTTVTTGDSETFQVVSDGTTNIDSTIFNAIIYGNPMATGEQFFVNYGTGSSEASYDGTVNGDDITVDLGEDVAVTRIAMGIQFKVKDVELANNQTQSWYLRVGLFNEKYGGANTISGIELGIFRF